MESYKWELFIYSILYRLSDILIFSLLDIAEKIDYLNQNPRLCLGLVQKQAIKI